MKRSGIVVFAALVMLLAGSAIAGPPLDGAYKSVDIGGPVYVGRYTEAWSAGGAALLGGTTFNAASWDGSTLGNQWRYWCSTMPSHGSLLVNTVNSQGNGNRTYMKVFSGGYIWLSGTGPWANGDPDYPGVIDSYVEFETITYSNWIPIAAITNVQASAHFDNYPSMCMSFYIGNGSQVASTDLGNPVPPNYPGFLDPNCNPTRTLGASWDFFTITLSIVDCNIGTEDATWGAIKSMFSE